MDDVICGNELYVEKIIRMTVKWLKENTEEEE